MFDIVPKYFICHLLTLLPLSLVLSSCSFSFGLEDPSCSGNAPYQPSEMWEPCTKPLYSMSCCANELVDESSIKRRGVLRLSDLIDIALRNNPKTFQSWSIARSFAYSWEISKAPYYPTLDAQETLIFEKQKFGSGGDGSDILSNMDDGTAMDVSGGNGVQYNQIVTHHLTSTFLLLDFGGRDANFESTRQALIAANWLHNRVLQDVVINVMQSYYSYLQIKALVDAKRDQLKDAQTSSDAAENQYIAGVKTKVDFLLAKSNLVNVQLQLEDLLGQLKISLGQVAASLGYNASIVLNLADLPKDFPLEDVKESVEDLIQVAMEERPDLAAAYANYFEKEANITIARSASLPTVHLTGNMEKFVNVHNPSQNGYLYDARIELDIPIFAGFLYENQVKKAQEELNIALAALEDKQNNLAFEVLNNYYLLKTAIETLKFAEEFLKYAQEAYNAAYANYKEGTGTILDLLTAQTALANARAQLITAKTQWITSLANLSYATGELLNDDMSIKIDGY